MNTENTSTSTSGTTFKAGVICFAFLLIGYQICLFVHQAAQLRIESLRDKPDTVYVQVPVAETKTPVTEPSSSKPSPAHVETPKVERRDAPHSPAVKKARAARRKVENFEFDPNTVSLSDLQRLGFSEKQAASIVNYRAKGGTFHRAEDFGKSYVVADSVFRRLKSYIRIPKLDINVADSAAFDALPGIGPYYASQMVQYREELGGYACTEQLMELYKFDDERYNKLKDLIECSEPHYFDLWNSDLDALARHPAIHSYNTARSILIYKENTASELWTVEALSEAGVINESQAERLTRCTLPAGKR